MGKVTGCIRRVSHSWTHPPLLKEVSDFCDLHLASQRDVDRFVVEGLTVASKTRLMRKILIGHVNPVHNGMQTSDKSDTSRFIRPFPLEKGDVAETSLTPVLLVRSRH